MKVKLVNTQGPCYGLDMRLPPRGPVLMQECSAVK